MSGRRRPSVPSTVACYENGLGRIGGRGEDLQNFQFVPGEVYAVGEGAARVDRNPQSTLLVLVDHALTQSRGIE